MKIAPFLTLLLISTAIAEEYTAKQFKEQCRSSSTGDYLVTDIVERISTKMTPGQYDIRLGGESFSVTFPKQQNQSYIVSENAMVLDEKETLHTTRGKTFSTTHKKKTIFQVGDVLSLFVKLSAGRVTLCKMASDEEKIAIKYKKDPTSTQPNAAGDAIIQARALQSEIELLEEEIRTGISGKATGQSISGMNLTQTRIILRFTSAEIEYKRKALAAKKTQLALLTAQ